MIRRFSGEKGQIKITLELKDELSKTQGWEFDFENIISWFRDILIILDKKHTKGKKMSYESRQGDGRNKGRKGMKKSELNEQIALYFGFDRSEKKEYVPAVSGFKGEQFYQHQWMYPDKKVDGKDWCLRQGCVPCYSIPDFVGILEGFLDCLSLSGFSGGPSEYFDYFNQIKKTKEK